jgi:hypothetical protein
MQKDAFHCAGKKGLVHCPVGPNGPSSAIQAEEIFEASGGQCPQLCEAPYAGRRRNDEKAHQRVVEDDVHPAACE